VLRRSVLRKFRSVLRKSRSVLRRSVLRKSMLHMRLVIRRRGRPLRGETVTDEELLRSWST
jgi:hypothetical protein